MSKSLLDEDESDFHLPQFPSVNLKPYHPVLAYNRRRHPLYAGQQHGKFAKLISQYGLNIFISKDNPDMVPLFIGLRTATGSGNKMILEWYYNRKLNPPILLEIPENPSYCRGARVKNTISEKNIVQTVVELDYYHDHKFDDCGTEYTDKNKKKSCILNRIEIIKADHVLIRARLCQNCRALAPKGTTFDCCAACKRAWYCSTECQAESWKKCHQFFCNFLLKYRDQKWYHFDEDE